MRTSTTTRLVRTVALAAALAAAALAQGGSDAAAVPGSAGLDTSLPPTDSATSLRGRGDFSDLEITLNQTSNLGNQAISVTWTGGTPTQRRSNATFGEHFLQIMQCWGEDDGTTPDNPGPPPEQCAFGASDAVYGGRNSTLFYGGGYVDDRIIARGDFERFDPDDGPVDPTTNWQWRPFRAVDGEVISTHIDASFSPAVGGGQYWLNPYFNAITTNEIAGARTLGSGTGQELFEVVTGLEDSRLGCGQKVLDVGGDPREPQCWLVVVPRGAAADENAGTIDDPSFAGNDAVVTSPLSDEAWRNRIAFPLDFNPLDSPCDLADDQRRIVGSELLVRALGSWQPTLCAIPGLTPYSFAIVSDDSARLQLSSGAPGGPGMAVVSRPLDPSFVSGDDTVVYAPLSVSAIVVGFNIERKPDVQTLTPESEAISGVRVAELNLTPRLVAKLLTQSYKGQAAIGNVAREDPWVQENPSNLDADPDFLRFNPEFELLQENSQKNMGGLVLTAGTSDAARQVWEWILADEEAARWLAGEADEWGMNVNPVYATTAALNPTGMAFGEPVPHSFPKADPYCYQAPDGGATGRVVAPPLCGTDWLPYALGLRDAAQRGRAANDGAKTIPDPFADVTEKFYRSDGPQLLGSRALLTMVDSPSAHQYGLQLARLSRAGDNGADRTFVAPDQGSMLAAVRSMAPADEPQVLEPDPDGDGEGYPLTTLTYGVVRPVGLDERSRAEYAAFLEYAAGDGQVPGEEIGQLPPGYAVLPEELQKQSLDAAATIIDPDVPGQEPAAPTTTVPQAAPTPPLDPSSAVNLTPAGGTMGGTMGGTGLSPVEPPAFDPQAPAPQPPVVADRSPDEVALDASPSGAVTPASEVGFQRWAVPLLVGSVLLSALFALEITKRPRRALPAALPSSETSGGPA